jgi:penicillin-binding protein 2
MFERRMKVFLVMIGAAMSVIIVRLIDLQIVRSDIYQEEARQILLRRRQILPFARGRILDRTGQALVSDEPAWNLCVSYKILSEVRESMSSEASDVWNNILPFSDVPINELFERADEITARIHRIREIVGEPIREEFQHHAIIENLSHQAQVEARWRFESDPNISVDHGVHRAYHNAVPFAHILGRTKPVDQVDLANDPNKSDELKRFLNTDRVGRSGVDYVAESMLRGRRGAFRERLGRSEEGGGRIVVENVPPQGGWDVNLTIRSDLQHSLYDEFADSIVEYPNCTGGSIIVLDIESREVLAMVSYPAYDPNEFNRRYSELRMKTREMPLRFKAVAERYAPGSIVKPLACLAALDSGVHTLNTTYDCDGYLFPNVTNAFRCWKISGTDQRVRHGSVNVVGALAQSCNIFMYRTGMAVGADVLTDYFHSVDLGRRSGMGLREESPGINPTYAWLEKELGRGHVPASARLYAIGQGELAITPVQAANLMAFYASGIHRNISIIRGGEPTPYWDLDIAPEHLRAIQQGMYEVVNDSRGTAYKYARFEHPEYCVIGKTGSAETPARRVSYDVSFMLDGRSYAERVYASSKSAAIKELQRMYPKAEVIKDEISPPELWPQGAKGNLKEDQLSHAWFGGYLQRIDGTGRPLWSAKPRIAFAVMAEFGGSGGATAGSMSKRVAGRILDILGSDLDPDAQPTVLAGRP